MQRARSLIGARAHSAVELEVTQSDRGARQGRILVRQRAHALDDGQCILIPNEWFSDISDLSFGLP